MALSTVVSDDGQIAGLNGVYVGQQTPELLGLNGLSAKVGNFYVGYDTRIKPTFSRIFFDTSSYAGKFAGDTIIGLVQSGIISYQGVPILPTSYDPLLSYLMAYIPPKPLSDLFKAPVGRYATWVNMLDAKTAQNKELTLPWFAYNGYLRNPSYAATDFSKYPMPNGSLTSIPAPDTNGEALCAMLAAPIDLDLDYPPEAVIRDNITKLIDRKRVPLTKVFTKEEVSSGSALDYALAMLEIDDPTTIEQVQVVGPFMLIQMADIEAEGPLFAAFYDGAKATDTTETMTILTLSAELFEELHFQYLTDLFTRIKDHLTLWRIVLEKGMPQERSTSAKGRGGSGLRSFPFFFSENASPVITFTYQTYAVALTELNSETATMSCLGGVETQVGRVFDPDSLEFGELLLRKPAPIFSEPFLFNQAISGDGSADASTLATLINGFVKLVQGSPIFFSQNTSPTFFENVPNTTTVSKGYGEWSKNWVK